MQSELSVPTQIVIPNELRQTSSVQPNIGENKLEFCTGVQILASARTPDTNTERQARTPQNSAQPSMTGSGLKGVQFEWNLRLRRVWTLLVKG